MNVLVISLAGIGDTIMATPALKALRDRFPDARLDVLVMQKAARDLLSCNPHVDEVLYWDFFGKRPLESLGYILGLRRRRYDVTVNAYPANRWEYNVVNCLAGGRWRLGHRYRHLDWANAGFLLTGRITEDDGLHNVEENLRLVDLLAPGCRRAPDPRELVVRIPEGSRRRGEQWLREKGLGTGFLVGLHPGCGVLKNHRRRRWPTDRFAGLARLLAEEAGTEVLVFGGPDEAELKERVVALAGPHAHPVTLPGLLDSAALLARCRFLVSNDSSFMHLAAALRVPVVGIFGPTNAVWVRPYNAPHVVVSKKLDCSPCFYYSPRPLRCGAGRGFACVRLITVDDVVGALDHLPGVKVQLPMVSPPSADAVGGEFSVVIPVRHGTPAPEALRGVAALEADLGAVEVFLARGTQPSRQRNLAAREARGEVLVFLDDDSVPAPDYLNKLRELFRDGSVVAVTGPNLASPSDKPLERAGGLVLSSFFGTFGVRARYACVGRRRPAAQSDVILCNFAARRKAFLEVGGFDERLYPNEENELLLRIRDSFGRASCIYDPGLVVRRGRSRSLREFAAKIFGYGRGRTTQVLVRPTPGSLVYFAPALFLFYLLALPLAPSWPFLAPLALYLVLDALSSVRLWVRERWVGALLAFLLFPLTHFAYGAGLTYEVLRAPFVRRQRRSAAVDVRRVKAFGEEPEAPGADED